MTIMIARSKRGLGSFGKTLHHLTDERVFNTMSTTTATLGELEGLSGERQVYLSPGLLRPPRKITGSPKADGSPMGLGPRGSMGPCSFLINPGAYKNPPPQVLVLTLVVF